jgi:diguanylate cyclase (GGDEF)-like protein/PAS domain S-box-containing protein
MLRRFALHSALMIGLLAVCPCVCAETIDLQLRWHHQFQFAGYYAAVQQGYYKKAGLDVVIHEGAPDKISINEVAQGHAQYGVANSELVLARLKGDPLVLLAAIYQHSPSVLLARKDANIYSPSDLIGKQVMMLGSYVDADFVAMFHNERLNIKDIQVIPSSFNIQDLATGKVDAFNSYISNEPYWLKQQGVEFTVLQPRKYGVDFYSDMLFTSENELKQHPERVKAFLNASLQGWQYAMAHPQDIIILLQSQYYVTKSKAHLEFEAEAMRDLMLPDLVEIGHINPWRLKYMADTFVQAGMVKNTDLLDGFFYNDDMDEERLNRYLKVMVFFALFISVIAVILYAAYHSIKRENQQRKRIAEQLRNRTDELALRNHVLYQINQGIALSELLDALARQVEHLHPKVLCSILLLDENNQLRHGAAPSLPDFYNQAIDGLAIGEGVGSCGTAAYRGERYVVEDIQQHPFWVGFRDLAKQAGVQSCWSQPIKNHLGKVLGTFSIYHAKPSNPLITEIELIEGYANLAQLGIEHTQADAALLESEQRLRFVLKGSGLGSWDWNIDTHIVEINTNNMVVSRYNYPKIHIAPPPWLDFIHPEDCEKVWKSIQAVLNGKQETHQIEYRVIDKTGAVRWILDSANIVQRDNTGKPIRISGIHADITERKLAERQLSDSENSLMLCQVYAGIGTWELDLIHHQQTLSPIACKLLGVSEYSETKWEDFLAVIHPDDFQLFVDATQAHLEQRTKYDVEYRIIDKDEQLRWMRSVGRVDESRNVEPTYFRGIVQDITERKAAEEQIKQLAFYDQLTNLPNRRLLNERLQHCMHIGQREGKQLAVLMLDLDRFKAVNDSLGHSAGDELLRQVAARIKAQLRKIDTPARLGGDEFVVLLPDINQYEDVERVALAIINELNQPFWLRENHKVNIGTSIGISFYPQHSNKPEILLDYADVALYKAKDQGRGCFCIFQLDDSRQHTDNRIVDNTG